MTLRSEKKRGLSRAFRSRSGFTLVEVAVAAVILTVVFVAAFGSLLMGYDLIQSARDQTRASQILQSEFEEIRTMNWTDLTGLPATQTYAPNSDFVAAFGNRYSITRTVTTKAVDQKQIAVLVSWTDGSSTKTLEYITWYTEDGFSDYYFRKI